MTGQTKAIIWILGVFVSGALFGGVVSYFATPSMTGPPPVGTGPPEAIDRPGPPGVGPALEPGEERRSLRPPQAGKRGGGDRRRGGQELQRLAQYLGLSPEQRAEVRRLFQENMRELQAAEQQHRTLQRQLRINMMRSLRSVLTDKQKELFDQFMRERQRHRRHPGQERRLQQPRRQ